tara:strand:- start:614 stop:862 length:249 start_codon:yes stop_codon:yes gene_type:complete
MKKVMLMTAAATTGAVSVQLKNRLVSKVDATKNFRGYREEEGACAGTEGDAVREDAKNIVLCKKLCNNEEGCTAWEYDKAAS